MSLINQYDIIGLQETKTDDADSYIEIPGYKIFFHNRNSMSRYRSGGIIILVKNEISPFVRVDQSKKSKLILFFSLSKELFNHEDISEDIQCGVVYVPPQGSKYATEDPYLELQEELFRYCTQAKNVILFGDFNSRCKNLPDYVKFDEFISEIHGMQDLYDESNLLYDYFQRYQIPLSRNSTDESMNNFGYSLLELCSNNYLFILNGRIGNDFRNPSLTCKNKSTIDYFISSAYVFPIIKNLQVHEFSSLYSDAHCPVSCTLTVNNELNQNVNNNNADCSETKYNLWNSKKKDNFVDNIDIINVSEFEMITFFQNDNAETSQNDIDEIISYIGVLFSDTSKSTFGYKTTKKSHGAKEHNKSKPWFNRDCRGARNLYNKTRHMYNKYKTNYYKNILKIVSKSYKITLSKHYKRYKNDKISKLRAIKRNNPRGYWKIINANKTTQDTKASVNDLFYYFKNLNETDTDEDENSNVDIREGFQLNETAEQDINLPITEKEILDSIKSLKNNKAHGPDSIVNEHIKSTAHIMIPTYVKLFNLILDSGIIPESWTVGTIKPIF